MPTGVLPEKARLEAERVKSEQMKVQERITRLQSERQQARLSKTSEAESKLGILRTGGGREGGNHGMGWGGNLKRDNTISLTSTIQETLRVSTIHEYHSSSDRLSLCRSPPQPTLASRYTKTDLAFLKQCCTAAAVKKEKFLLQMKVPFRDR